MEITLFYIPCPSELYAKRMGDALLEEKLVACTHVFPVASSYPWQGVMEHAHETILLLKTLPAYTEAVLTKMRTLHPYEVPALLHWKVQANADYIHWMQSVLMRT